MNREFLQLAKDYEPRNHDIYGWFVSEKFDGMRALWDGGITRGLLSTSVPWGSEPNRVSTGLWSRYGKVISAPDWWLNCLPSAVLLDGELFKGYGLFQETLSACKKHTPIDSEWADVRYYVFDSPSLYQLMANGTINNANMKVELNPEIIVPNSHILVEPIGAKSLSATLANLPDENEVLRHVKQTRLPSSIVALELALTKAYEETLEAGGEGLIVRNPSSIWSPFRVKTMLKMKPIDYDIGVVVGWYEGEGEDKGMLGSLTLRWRNVIFKLSATGMKDVERILSFNAKDGLWPTYFPPGTRVNFKYNGTTVDGKPRIARYMNATP
jgi:DNA ligase-1